MRDFRQFFLGVARLLGYRPKSGTTVVVALPPSLR